MRTDDSVVRVAGRRTGAVLLRRSRGYVADAASPCRTASPVPVARLRRRAQEHLLRREGRAGLGRPPHRRPQELGDAASRSAKASSTSSACSPSSRVWSRTTCTRTTSRPATRSSARASRPSASSTTTRTSRRASPSTVSEGRRSARSSTAPATAATARCGAASCSTGGLARVRAGGDADAGPPPGRRRRGERAVAHGGVVARARVRRGGARRCPRRSPRRRTPTGRRSAGWSASGAGSPRHDERGQAVRRGRGPLRHPCARELRGPGGGGARGHGRSGRAGRLSDRASRAAPGAPLVLDPRGAIRALDVRCPGAAPPCRSWRLASTTASRRPRPRRAHGSASDRTSISWSCRAACSRTGCCSSGRWRGLHSAGLRTLIPEKLPPNDGGIAYGQVAVASARLR